jgi:hypothetical protein
MEAAAGILEPERGYDFETWVECGCLPARE